MADAVHIGDDVTLYCGDCLDVMPGIDPVDAIVCDPPYGLAFMGKDWDHGVPGIPFWEAALGAAKPGAHLLAFGGTRTYHRLACAIEDAGWEIRDCIMWVYGSGFPKSHNVGKAIDKAAGAVRDVVGRRTDRRTRSALDIRGGKFIGADERIDLSAITAPATDAAKQWDGWGTALKPAVEPIIVARKPFKGTVAANVQEHGTGALNIDACRVEGELPPERHGMTKIIRGGRLHACAVAEKEMRHSIPTKGRWPSNLIHDGSAEATAGFPYSKGQQGEVKGTEPSTTGKNCYGKFRRVPSEKREDTGSASRYFYCAKASKADRDEGLDGAPLRPRHTMGSGIGGQPNKNLANSKNIHPTVKPTSLMRYLVRLVTQPGGVVLDPFMGSGSTGKAARLEGMRFVGIEREPEYLAIAQARIDATEHAPQQTEIASCSNA